MPTPWFGDTIFTYILEIDALYEHPRAKTQVHNLAHTLEIDMAHGNYVAYTSVWAYMFAYILELDTLHKTTVCKHTGVGATLCPHPEGRKGCRNKMMPTP